MGLLIQTASASASVRATSSEIGKPKDDIRHFCFYPSPSPSLRETRAVEGQWNFSRMFGMPENTKDLKLGLARDLNAGRKVGDFMICSFRIPPGSNSETSCTGMDLARNAGSLLLGFARPSLGLR